MGRYHFYDYSPNEYCFMDEDLGWSEHWQSNFDQYDFCYEQEELQKALDPSMMHKGGVTSSVVLMPNVMMKCPLPTRSDCIHNQLGSRAQLYNSHISFSYGDRLIHHIGIQHVQFMRSILTWNYLFYIKHFL
jgi:hypothetical protein